MADSQVILNYDLQPSPQTQSKLQAQMATLERNLRLNGPFSGMAKSTQDFNYQLDRATQRVITLGTAFNILSTSNRVLQSIVTNTIAVDKAMVNLNAIFKLTNDSVTKLTSNLFDLSREAATPFAETAKAAEEFARQGLSANKVLEATRAALILSRDAGIDVADSVKALTAATNSFSKEALGYIQIANRIATVDTSFAISSKDLQEALVRTGSAASDAGLSFNQFIGLVTSAQQISQRGGAVISQALNTIFTRIGRKDTLDSLEGLGVAITDLQGQTLPTITILQNFARAYDGMTGSIKNQAAELVGGVRNLNTLKATLKDLSRENSVFAQSQQLVANSTNQAEARNAARNQSLAAQLEQLKLNGQQIGSNIGNIGFNNNTSARGSLSILNNNPIIDALKDADKAETVGGTVAQAFIKGFGGAVLFGLSPLLVTILGTLGAKVFGNLGRDLISAARLTDTQRDQAAIESQIVSLYKAGGAALEQQLATMTSLAERAAYLKTLLSSGTAGASFSAEAAAIYQGGYRARRAAGGYIPMGQESAAIAGGVGGAPLGAKPVYLPNFNLGGGQRGIVANTSERIVNMAGGSAIYNENMIQRMGIPPGSTPVAAGGYVPFAAAGMPNDQYGRQLLSALNTHMPLASPTSSVSTDQLATDYNRALKEISQSAKEEARQAKQRSIEMEKGFKMLQDENDARSKTSVLTSAQIKQSERYLTALQSLYDSARMEGAQILEKSRSIANAPIIGGSRAVTEIRPVLMGARSPYQVTNEGILSDRATLLNTAAASNRVSSSSDTERIKAVYRQQMVEERQAARQGEIAAQNVRLEKLRRQLDAARNPDLYDPNFIGPRAPAGWRSSLTETAPRGPSFLSRFNSRLNTPGASLALGIGLPFLGSNINEGVGGTPSGIARSIGSNALNFGGFGATAGSLIPGVGTAAGAGIGAAIGALYGWVMKASKSFEELAVEIDQANKKRGEEFTHVGEVFDINDQIKAASANGDQSRVADLKRQRGIALSRVHRADYRDIIANQPGDEGRIAAGTLNANESSALNLGDSLRSSLAFGNRHSGPISNLFQGSAGLLGSATRLFSDYDSKDLSPATQNIQSILSQFSRSQIGDLQKMNGKNPRKVLEIIARTAGLRGDELQGVLGGNGTFSRDAVGDALHGLLNQDSSITGSLDKSNANDNIRVRGLTSRAASFREKASFGNITASANRQIEQVRQQIALQNPSLTDLARLQQSGTFGAADIAKQIGAERASTLNAGKGQLFQTIAGTKDIGADVGARVSKLGSAADVRALIADLTVENGGAARKGLEGASQENSPIKKALEELAARMEELDKTQTENTRANNEGNKLLMDQLRERKTYGGALKEDIGSIEQTTSDFVSSQDRKDSRAVIEDNAYKMLRARLNTQRRGGLISEGQSESIDLGFNLTQGFNNQQRQRDAVLAQARAGNSLISGDDISGALFENAQTAGRQGNTKTSLTGGFTSVFAGLKRDMADFSAIGKNLADSLNNNLGGAFGEFVTGAKKGKDAFRDFATSVLSDASRMLASKAFSSLLGAAFGSLGGPAGATGGEFTGNAFSFAGGGTVPTMLMGGEYVLGPKAARSVGYSTLKRLNGYTGMADGGFVTGGSGVMDDRAVGLPPGSFVIRKGAAQRLGGAYLNALASGPVQHRAGGGAIGGFGGGFGIWGALLGAVIGGGLGYLAGGKKGAIGGALLGGIGGGLYQGSGASSYGAVSAETAFTPATLSVGEKAVLGLGASAGLGLLAGGIGAPKSGPGPISIDQVAGYKRALEAQQASSIAGAGSKFPYLQIGPQGQNYIAGYTDAPATRRWAEGGGVDAPMISGPSSNAGGGLAGAAQVNIKVEINNNGSATSSATSNGQNGGGFGPDFADKLNRQIRGVVQDELVQQSRSDGFLTQKSRFVNRV